MEFEFDEDTIINLRDWLHHRDDYIYSLIIHLYHKQERDNFNLHRDLEDRQLALGLIDISTVNPNPMFDIDLFPDEGYEF